MTACTFATANDVSLAVEKAIKFHKSDQEMPEEMAFSLKLVELKEEGWWLAEIAFSEMTKDMTVMYWKDTDNDAIMKLWNLDSQAIDHITGIMLENGWHETRRH